MTLKTISFHRSTAVEHMQRRSLQIVSEQPDRTEVVCDFRRGNQNAVRHAVSVLCRQAALDPYDFAIVETMIGTAAGSLDVWRLAIRGYASIGVYAAGILHADRLRHPRGGSRKKATARS